MFSFRNVSRETYQMRDVRRSSLKKMGRKTEKQIVGNTGENIACMFLMKHGFDIVQRNYSRKCGEIDIIAKKKGILHFIEVKTVSHETKFRPEENVHQWKVERLKKAIQIYFIESNGTEDSWPPWQFDLISVFLDREKHRAGCRFSENIIL